MNAPTREKSDTDKQDQHSGRTSRNSSELITDDGRTSIADSVVSKVVGMATREVPGVYAMGAGVSRALGAVRDRLGGSTGSGLTQGVMVEVGERQAAVDLNLTVDYGVSIPDLAAGVRRNVSNAVEKICGLEVTEVNISVDDVHLPSDDEDGDDGESRVE